jgi:predicted metal-binding protein
MRQIVLCSTCRFSSDSKFGPDGRTGGALLTELIQESVRHSGTDDISIQTQPCLWNCSRPCSVILRDSERFTYVTGGHEPTQDQADAIVQWFVKHGATDTGEVPFREWPDRMRGHFIARLPRSTG